MAFSGFLHVPGTCPNCCPDCLIGQDKFTTDEISGDWNIVSGDWDNISGKLHGIDAGIIIYQEPIFPTTPIKLKVSINILTDVTFRVLVGYLDIDNYYFVEVRADSECGELQLGSRFGGNESWLTDSYPLVSTGLALNICYIPCDKFQIMTPDYKVWLEADISNNCEYVQDEDGEIITDESDNASSNEIQADAQSSYYVLDEEGNQILDELGNPIEEESIVYHYTGLEIIEGEVDFDNWELYHHGDDPDYPKCPKCFLSRCLLNDDLFEELSNENPGCWWEEVTGDWDILNGTLVTTGGILLNKVPHPNNTSELKITLRFLIESVGGIASVLFAYESITEYLMVSIELTSEGCGQLSIYQNTGSGNVLIGQHTVPLGGLEANTWYPLSLCYSYKTGDIYVHVNITNSYDALHYTSSTHHVRDIFTVPVAPKVGLSASGSVKFDDWYYYRLADDELFSCPTCSYEDCLLYRGPVDEGCYWDTITGTWNDGNETDDTGALKVLKIGHPGVGREGLPDYTQRVYAQVRYTEYGDKIRIIVDYLDDENYHYVQLEAPDSYEDTTGRLVLGKRTGGVDAELSAEPVFTYPYPTATEYNNIWVCFDAEAGLINGYSSQGVIAGVAMSEETTAHNGQRIAVGTDTVVGTITFGEILYTHDIYHDNCPGCGALSSGCRCEPGTMPEYVIIKIEGVKARQGYPCGARYITDPLAEGGGYYEALYMECENPELFNGYHVMEVIPYVGESVTNIVCYGVKELYGPCDNLIHPDDVGTIGTGPSGFITFIIRQITDSPFTHYRISVGISGPEYDPEPMPNAESGLTAGTDPCTFTWPNTGTPGDINPYKECFLQDLPVSDMDTNEFGIPIMNCVELFDGLELEYQSSIWGPFETVVGPETIVQGPCVIDCQTDVDTGLGQNEDVCYAKGTIDISDARVTVEIPEEI